MLPETEFLRAFLIVKIANFQLQLPQDVIVITILLEIVKLMITKKIEILSFWPVDQAYHLGDCGNQQMS